MDIYKTDWITSQPVFYNDKTGKISHNVNDVIDYSNFEFHNEGFNNYLEFGYSVFNQTPVKNVKFLSHSSSIQIDNENKIKIDQDVDIAEKWYGEHSSEDDVIQKIITCTQIWEKSVEGDIVIPTSGGFDSRLLNIAISDKSRIRSFTYGLSENQCNSFEVVLAKSVIDRLGIEWKQIELGNYLSLFNEWDNLFGVTTHAHGMYQIEFFKKILNITGSGCPMLSGIFGDIWAGNTKFQKISIPDDIIKLGYTHGLCADKEMSLLKNDTELRNEFYEKNIKKLNDHFFQVLILIRLKIILISYLLKVPSSLGFKVWSPFLLPEIALGMLTLPQSRRDERIWQKEFFKNINLNVEDMNNKADYKNVLHLQAMTMNRCEPLNLQLLKEVVKPSYIDWINKSIDYKRIGYDRMKLRFFNLIKVDNLLGKAGIKYNYNAYFAYLTLKPIENLLKKRNGFVN